jgi:hypothetical protein
MLKTLSIFFVLYSQFLIAQETVTQPEFEGYKLMRADENEAFWLKNKKVLPYFNTLKLIQFNKSKSINLTIGGQIRPRYELVQNDNWSKDNKEDKSTYSHRLTLHNSLQLGKHFRLFGELYSAYSEEKKFAQYDELDLHQAFAEISYPINQTNIKLTIGRLEFNYGSGRIVSLREGPNVRRSFDAVKGIIVHNHFKTELFFGKEVKSKFEVFDNNSQNQPIFWGFNSAFLIPKISGNNEFYYYGYKRDNAKFQNISGNEIRHTFGLRRYGNLGKHFMYNSGILYQFGSIRNSTISAFSAQTDWHYMWNEFKHKPNIGLKMEYASGDSNPTDNRLNTFNPMFNNPAYFGLLGKMTSMNLMGIHPSFQINLSKKIKAKSEANFYWRANKNDGLYAPSLVNTRLGNGNLNKFIGTQFGESLDWEINQNLTLSNEFAYFLTGKFFSQSGNSENILYNSITLNFRF